MLCYIDAKTANMTLLFETFRLQSSFRGRRLSSSIQDVMQQQGVRTDRNEHSENSNTGRGGPTYGNREKRRRRVWCTVASLQGKPISRRTPLSGVKLYTLGAEGIYNRACFLTPSASTVNVDLNVHRGVDRTTSGLSAAGVRTERTSLCVLQSLQQLI